MPFSGPPTPISLRNIKTAPYEITNYILEIVQQKYPLKFDNTTFVFGFFQKEGPDTCTRARNSLLNRLTVDGIDPSQGVLLYFSKLVSLLR